jgi:P4 family phage/plasmid primase-like protien
LIEDIEEYTKLDLKEYYFNQNKKDMNDIFNIWYKTIKDKNDGSMRVKGQKDIERLDDFLENFKVLKNKKDFKEYTRDAVISIFEDEKVYENLSEEKKKEKALGYTEAIDSMIKNYESIYKDYRQTGIADMFLAFERLAYNTGYTLAKYDDSLAVWTGTHYHVIDDRVENFKGWLSTSWMPLSGVDIKKILKRNVDEIFDNLHLRAMSLNKIHHYQKDRRIFNFTNGTLTVGKKGRRTFTKIHDKKHGVMNMLDFEYDEKATAPKWEKFLHRVLPDEQDRRTLMEFMGYCFFPGHDYEAFLYLEGKTGANGKSVIIDVIKLFFGEENLSSLNIQNLYGHALQGLANKIINTGSEVNTKNLIHNQMDVLKALTSTNDAIQIDPKHTKGYPLESRHQPKMIFASNSGLDPRGLDDGVLRRALPIKFVAEIKDGEKIRDLSNRFKDELSGIMNLALQGLDRLVKNGKFTKSNTLLKSIEESKDQANPIRAYAKNTLRTYGKNFIPKKLLYLHYKTYMEEKGYYSANELTFFKALADYIPFETKTQRRFPHDHHLVELFDNDRITCISGVYIIDEEISKFNFNSKAINTNSININPDTKHINIDQTMKEEN